MFWINLCFLISDTGGDNGVLRERKKKQTWAAIVRGNEQTGLSPDLAGAGDTTKWSDKNERQS
jgi:hypothetical protein